MKFWPFTVMVAKEAVRDYFAPLKQLGRPIPPMRSLTISVICFVIALACLVVIFSGCASSRTGRVLNVGIVAAGALDLHSTHQALEHGAREANPAMNGSLARQALLKAAGVSTVIALVGLVEERGHRVTAHVVRVVTIAAWSVVAARNYRLR